MFNYKILFLTLPFLILSAFMPSANLETAVKSPADKAPDFRVITVDGQEVSLKKSLKEKKPTVIYFTASWCAMCAKNWPALSEVYPEYKDKINFVAISIDPTDDADVMKKLVKERNVTFPVAAGDPKVMVDLGVKAQATTLGIDRKGNIEFKKKAVMNSKEFRLLFDELLKAS